MIQVASFRLPEQEKEANDFLKTHKPSHNGINFNKDTIIVFHETPDQPVQYQLAELYDYLKGIEASRIQYEVSLAVLQDEIEGVNYEKNNGKWQDLNNKMEDIKDTLHKQTVKTNFVCMKINELLNSA